MKELTSWPCTVFKAFPSNEACLTLSLTCMSQHTMTCGQSAIISQITTLPADLLLGHSSSFQDKATHITK